jgi:hypothetical protein
MKCDNCSNEAQYTHADPGVNAVHYCRNCLPEWLHERAHAGHFPLVKPIVEETPVVEEVVEDKLAKKKKPVVVEEVSDDVDAWGTPIAESDESN